MMRERFSDLWKRLKVERDPGEEFARLQQFYSEPHRTYHNIDHVFSCLSAFAQPRFLSPSPLAIEFAIWYHDAVYDPRRDDNEEKSARLAVEAIHRAGLNGRFSETTAKIILSTKEGAQRRSLECMFMADVDNSVLGRDPPVFRRYEKGIRAEFSHLTPDEYKKGRIKVLQGFLARPSIYYTGCFRAVYETKARENLQTAVQRLSRSPKSSNRTPAILKVDNGNPLGT